MRTIRRWLGGAIMALAVSTASAQLRLPHVFSDNMILQREKPVAVWGWAAPGEHVAVSFGDQNKESIAGADGRWRITLDPMPASDKPRAMICTARAQGSKQVATLRIENILVGEVWLCSGQSNMQWSLPMALDGEHEVASATDELIRFLAVPLKQSRTPFEDIEGGAWRPATSNAAREVSAVAYFFARQLRRELGVPVGLLQAAWGGSLIQPWTPPEGYASVPSLAGTDRLTPEALKGPIAWDEAGCMYNAIIAPLVPFGIRGFLWYQGESNSPEGMKYTDRMLALINGWRGVWHDRNLPFYFVQICPYVYPDQDLQFLWMAQGRVPGLTPHTGIAVTTDLGDLGDIHPKRKQEVGARLARLALHGTYGRKDVLPNGPIYRSHAVEGNRIRVRFDNSDGGLTMHGGDMPGAFEVAGTNLEYVSAAATVEGETVLVGNAQVAEPRAVRFGWTHTPATNLINRAGIPVLPFCSDQTGCDVNFKLMKAFRLHEAVIPATGSAMQVSEVVTNPFSGTVTFRYQWRTAGTSWRMEPAEGMVTLAPKKTATLVAAGTFDRSSLRPFPALVMSAEPEPGQAGVAMFQMSAWCLREALALPDDAAPMQTGFGDPQTGIPVNPDTAFRVSYDATQLRVAVTAAEPEMGGLVSKITMRDGMVWTDDSIELFILPGSDQTGRYYHFIANVNGGRYDGAGGPGCGMFGDAKWNGEWTSAGSKSDGAFTIEFSIPFATLGVAAPKPGTAWYMNVCRNRQSRKAGGKTELSTWSQTAGIYHTPSRFGRLIINEAHQRGLRP